jgi:hypothetical protein
MVGFWISLDCKDLYLYINNLKIICLYIYIFIFQELCGKVSFPGQLNYLKVELYY